LKIVLGRDTWLTGFDAPSSHTMYVDKPMRSYGLMHAIARVNRVFETSRLYRVSPHRREFDLRAENHYYGAPFR